MAQGGLKAATTVVGPFEEGTVDRCLTRLKHHCIIALFSGSLSIQDDLSEMQCPGVPRPGQRPYECLKYQGRRLMIVPGLESIIELQVDAAAQGAGQRLRRGDQDAVGLGCRETAEWKSISHVHRQTYFHHQLNGSNSVWGSSFSMPYPASTYILLKFFFKLAVPLALAL